MTKKIYCPQCETENDSSASQCIHCGYHFISNSLDSSSESDWLSFLRGDEDKPTDETEFRDDTEDFPEPLESDNQDSPEWLKRIREIKQADSEFDNMESRQSADLHSPTSTTNDDLIRSLREEEVQPEEETSDWLSEYRNAQGPNEEEETLENEPSKLPEADSSDTLSTLEEIKKNWQIEFPASHDPEDDINVLPAEEFPDWLSKNISDVSEKDEILDDSDIPDWLSPVQSEPIEGDTESREPFDLPDWLSKENFLVDEDPNSNSESDSNTQSEELFEFLKEINPGKAQLIVDEPNSEDDSNMSIEDTYDSVLLFNRLEMLPDKEPNEKSTSENIQADQLELNQDNIEKDQKDVEKPAFIFDDSELKSLSVSPFIGVDDNEDWLNIPETPSTEEKEIDDDYRVQENEEEIERLDESFSPFNLDDLPDWLENVNLEDKEAASLQSFEDEKISDSSEEPEIEKGNLPEWLKAIRPVEAVSPQLSKQKSKKKIEQSGPLAGFRGVLSSENITKNYLPPPAYSTSINVTDKQKAHLKILEEIISPTQQTNAVKKKPKSFFHQLENYLIPIFLFLIVIYSSFIDHSDINFPQIMPPEAIRFHALTTGYLNRNQLPSHVLIIFETDAGSYPEMNLISKAFFENLFINNHWVTSISTNPNAVLVSEKILNNVHLKVPSYNFEERNINLGYLPGYGIGIQSFLINPRETSPGIDFNIDVWGKAPLSEINSVKDFDMIVLLTDNSENAKLWIEQINLLVEEPNLVLISTTKASPLIQPYLRTNQVDGMLSGMMGGLAFNVLSQTETNDIGRYWAINQLIVMLFVFFLLAGGVISIFNKAFSSEHSEKIK